MPEGDPSVFVRTLYGCDGGDVAGIVILTPIKEMFDALKRCAADVEEFSGFYKGFTCRIKGMGVSVFNSMVGSPLASDCTYYLRFTPCRIIIYVGEIGALKPHIRVGDIIVPTAALRGEGASRYFVDESYPAVADFGLLSAVASTLDEVYAGKDIDIHYGAIYTTDSFAAETDEFLEEWGSRNLIGIEMETSAIYTVAGLVGIRAAAFHVVSDNPVAERSFFHPFTEEEKGRRRECTGLVIEALGRLVSRI